MEIKRLNSTWKWRKTKQMLLFYGTEYPRRNKSPLEFFACVSPEPQEDADGFSRGFAC